MRILRPRRFLFNFSPRSGRVAIHGLVAMSLLAGFSAFSAQPLAVSKPPETFCQTAADCFQQALKGVKKTMRPQTESAVDPISALKRVHLQFPDSEWGKRAGIRLGLHLAGSDPETAVQLFHAGQKDFPILDDYLRFWLGNAQLEAGRPRLAAQVYESVVQENPDSVLRTDAVFQGAEAWFQADECRLAIPLFRQGLKQQPQSELAPMALLNLGVCEHSMGRLKNARKAFREIWWRFPTTPESETALEFLKRYGLDDNVAPTPDERFKRALAFYKEASFEEAVSELRRFLTEVPSRNQHYFEAQYKLGNALARLKRYDLAEEIFQKLSMSRSRQAGAGTVWLARVYLRRDKGTKLLTIRDQASSRGASGNQQALIHVFAGVWLEDQGKYDQAIQSFHRAAKVGRSSKRKLDALWRIGWRQYLSGEYSKAISVFKDMQDIQDTGQEHARASYWMARAMDHLTQRSQAQALYQELAHQVPFTYYGQLAYSRLLPSTTSATSAIFEPSPPFSQAQDTSGLLKNSHYKKAVELVGLNLFQEAAQELKVLTPIFGSDPGALPQFLTMAQQAHAYHVGIRLAIQHYGRELKQGHIPPSSKIWTWAYPNGYLPTIQSYASSALDPYLVAGLIREESLYNPFAVSYVGALGLMQLMPTTADVVARQLGLATPDREELFDAEANIQLGTTYVNELLGKFKGNLIHAVAAYNAGPVAVNRWIAKNGSKSADEFVESISYRETRRYVKRVLGSYRVYHTLALGSCRAASLDRMC